MITQRIFITGIAGFIGFHLALKLKTLGFEVLGYDNFNAYYDPLLKKERALLLKEQNIEIIEGDLVDFIRLEKSLSTFKPHFVVHLAAQAGVRHSLKDPHTYIQSNIVGFTNILEVLKNTPTIPLIYASSSSVYGANTKTPFSEEDPTEHPINLYGATKKANELLAYSYHHLYGMQTIGLRFFTVYGPWGRPDMAYYFFAKRILNNEPIPVYEGSKIQRDFTYIDDIVEGICLALNCKEPCCVFNLGNHKPIYLNVFIETLEKALGKKAIIDYQPKALGDMSVTYADLTKSKRLLGYNPKIELFEGLSRFSQWFVHYHSKKALL